MDSNFQPKNEYFARKEEKEKAAREERREKIIRKMTWWFVGLAVLALVAWWGYNYFRKASVEGLPPGEFFKAQSRDHVNPGQEHSAYNSNPPTGGWHYDRPAQSGIYDVEIADETIIHNLEHSHIWIAYHPDLSIEEVDKLAEIAKDYGSRIVMTKRAANDSKIALVAWEHLLKMDLVDEALIRRFIDAHRGLAGPEKVPDFGFKDFRK